MKHILLPALMIGAVALPACGLEGVSEESAGASVETSQAVAALIEGGVKVSAGAASLPLGSAGALSTGAGMPSLQAAGFSADYFTAPITIDPDVIVSPVAMAVPPLPRAADTQDNDTTDNGDAS